MGIIVEEKGPDQTLMEVKGLLRRVRSAAGAARFGVPIGTVIRPDVVPNRPTHVSTRIDATGGDSSIKPLKGIDKDLDNAVLKGQITIRRAREIQSLASDLGSGWRSSYGNRGGGSGFVSRDLGNGKFRHVAVDSNNPSKFAVWETDGDGEVVQSHDNLSRAQALSHAKKA